MPRQPRQPIDPEFDPRFEGGSSVGDFATSRELLDSTLRSRLSDDSRTAEQRAIDARDDLADAAERIEELKQAIHEGTAAPNADETIASLRALMLDATLELRGLGEAVDTDLA